MKKIITKYGNSFVIKLNPDDRKIYDLNEGDLIEITITKITKKQNGNKNRP